MSDNNIQNRLIISLYILRVEIINNITTFIIKPRLDWWDKLRRGQLGILINPGLRENKRKNDLVWLDQKPKSTCNPIK